MTKRVWIVAGMALLATACSSKKDASEDTFRALVSEERSPDSCIRIVWRGHAADVSDLNIALPPFLVSGDITALVDAGYLEQATNPNEGDDTVIYIAAPSKASITRKFSDPLSDTGSGYTFGFCPGKFVIDTLTFTEPAEFNGEKVSNVTATWHIEDVPEDFQKLIDSGVLQGSQKAWAAKPGGENSYRYRLTNNGWDG
jgi:hypothetical protein